MSYNKRVWANGDLITKERMNNIEDGIYDAHDKIDRINNKVEGNTTDTNTARQDISDIKLQIKEIANVSSFYDAKGDGVTDDTQAIQKLLDKRGIVIIDKPGTYIVGKLIIDDDTTLILGKNVKFKLKNGVSDYMLINKGEVSSPKYRNKNISIIGGEFDFNKNNNPVTGSYLNGRFPGHGIFFHKVDGLKIEGIVNATNAKKYAFLIGDATNVSITNSNVQNTSDAFHFSPPINNMQLSNLTGYSDDNYIGLIMGDYENYFLNDEGGFNNIKINNIHLNKDYVTLNAIRLCGSGVNNAYMFENIEISNVIANTGKYPIIDIPNQDLAGNSYDTLKKTIIKNIKISNIKSNAKSLSEKNAVTSIIYGSAKIDQIKISDMNYDPALYPLLIRFEGQTKKVILENIKVNNEDNIDNIEEFISIGTSAVGGSYKLEILNSDFTLNSVNEYSIIKSYNNSLKNINIDNCNFNLTNGNVVNFEGTTTEPKNSIYFNNCYFENVRSLVKVNVKLNMNMSNCIFEKVENYIADLCNIGKLTLSSSSCFCGSAKFYNYESPATLRIKGVDMSYQVLLSELQAVDSDLVRIQNGNEPKGKGLYLNLDGNWKRIFLSGGRIDSHLLPNNDIDCGTTSNRFRNGVFKGVVACGAGATSSRPTDAITAGMYFDLSLNKPIWYVSGKWYDANGTEV